MKNVGASIGPISSPSQHSIPRGDEPAEDSEFLSVSSVLDNLRAHVRPAGADVASRTDATTLSASSPVHQTTRSDCARSQTSARSRVLSSHSSAESSLKLDLQSLSLGGSRRSKVAPSLVRLEGFHQLYAIGSQSEAYEPGRGGMFVTANF